MEDRRRVPRQPTSWRGVCSIEGESPDRWRECHVIDMSELGLGIEFQHVLPSDLVGRRITVDLRQAALRSSSHSRVRSEVPRPARPGPSGPAWSSLVSPKTRSRSPKCWHSPPWMASSPGWLGRCGPHPRRSVADTGSAPAVAGAFGFDRGSVLALWFGHAGRRRPRPHHSEDGFPEAPACALERSIAPPAESTRREKAITHDVRSIRPTGTSRRYRPRSYLRPEHPRLRGQSGCRGRRPRRPRSATSCATARRNGPGTDVRHTQPSSRRVGLAVDAAEVLLPVPLHTEGVCEMLGYGWHLNLQKPMCSDLDEAAADARTRPERTTASCESWRTTSSTSRCWRLKQSIESGEIGDGERLSHENGGQPHGGSDVPHAQLRVAVRPDAPRPGHPGVRRRLAQARDCPVALRPLREVRAWVGYTEVMPTIEIDAPTTITWEHQNGIPRRVGHHFGPRDVSPI